jgi:hypothetical protein
MLFLIGVFVVFSILAGVLAYYYPKEETKPNESYSHVLSIYTAEGDTIFDIDTNSDWVKVWIGDSCEVDVWTINEEGGWTRK